MLLKQMWPFCKNPACSTNANAMVGSNEDMVILGHLKTHWSVEFSEVESKIGLQNDKAKSLEMLLKIVLVMLGQNAGLQLHVAPRLTVWNGEQR